MNDSRRTGILRLRHLREVSEAHAEEMDALRPRFERLSRKDAAPRIAVAFNLFQTPEALARRLASMFPDGFKGRTLEPSAGLGRLYRAVREVDRETNITLVDNAPDCVRELYLASEGDAAATLTPGDFLGMSDSLGLFDSIIMNPPFKMGTDVKHILHARTLLAPGGRLVSLCAAGPKQRAKLQPIADEWHDLPAGTFASEGTQVNAAIVTFTN